MRGTIILVDLPNVFHRHVFGQKHLVSGPSREWSRIGASVVTAIARVESACRATRTALALDTGPYWRTRIYPTYKHGRDEAKARSGIAWGEAEGYLVGKLVPELVANPCRKIFRVAGAEADDIIGVLAKRLSEDGYGVVIFSGDRDLLQLQRFANVRQHDGNGFVTVDDPVVELERKVLMGDTGDMVGNVLMDNDACDRWARRELRKPALGEAKADAIIAAGPKAWAADNGLEANYVRNRALLDLGEVPEGVVRDVLGLLRPRNAAAVPLSSTTATAPTAPTVPSVPTQLSLL